jgi:hypothetical protein
LLANRRAGRAGRFRRHANNKSLRLEAGNASADACVRSAPISLTLGKRYELSGWVRTENLTVSDLDRSPIALGAALTMASMPFDVHSAAVGGTRAWTRLSLRFVASRTQDSILLTAGSGGKLGGKAWFEGVSLDEVSAQDEWPAREAVQTFGPAYRYPAAGWIYLHIEGKPYDRGYQHGYLMAREIPEYLERCAFELGGQGRRADLEPIPHFGQRPFPARIRPRDSGRNARHRRRRQCQRREVAESQARPDRHRGGQYRKWRWANCARPCP